MEHLAQAGRFAPDDGVVLGELQRDVGPQIFVQGEHIEQEGVEIDRLHLAGARLPGIDREVVDHMLHRRNLRDYRLCSPHERFLIGAVELAREFDREVAPRTVEIGVNGS